MKIINFYQTATEYMFSKLPLAEKDPERPGVTASTATYKVKMSQVISQEESSLQTQISGSSDPRELVSRGWFIRVYHFVTNNLLTGG